MRRSAERVLESERSLEQHRLCTFCGKCEKELFVLIAGPMLGGYVQFICDECVELCQGIVAEYRLKEDVAPPNQNTAGPVPATT